MFLNGVFGKCQLNIVTPQLIQAAAPIHSAGFPLKDSHNSQGLMNSRNTWFTHSPHEILGLSLGQ